MIIHIKKRCFIYPHNVKLAFGNFNSFKLALLTKGELPHKAEVGQPGVPRQRHPTGLKLIRLTDLTYDTQSPLGEVSFECCCMIL